MKIKWFGHSCFLLTSETGVKVLTDPFDSKVGYRLPAVEADIVTTSHSHYDHNYIQAVKGKFKLLSQPVTYECKGVKISGVEAFHDEAHGAKRGKNTIYTFDMDGLRICHCGDLGHFPSKEQAASIGIVDILMIPVGGTYTLDASEAAKVVEQLKPKVAVPMHFKTHALSFPLDGADKFLAAVGITKQAAFAGKQEVEVSQESLGLLPKVLVLDYE